MTANHQKCNILADSIFRILLFLSFYPNLLVGQYKYDDHKHPTDLNFDVHHIDKSQNAYIRQIRISNDIIWALTYDHLYKFNSGKFHMALDLDESKSSIKVDKILTDKLGRVWLSSNTTPYNLVVYDEISNKLRSVFDLPELKNQRSKIIQSKQVYNDPDNNIWWKISNSEFTKLSTEIVTINIDSKEQVIKLLEIDNQLFAQTKSGLSKVGDDKTLMPIVESQAKNLRISKGVNLDFLIYADNEETSTLEIFQIKDNQVKNKDSINIKSSKVIYDQYLYHESTNTLINGIQNTFHVNQLNFGSKYIFRLPFYPTGHPIYDKIGNIYLPTVSGLVSISEKKYPFYILNKTKKNSFRHLRLLKDSVLQYATYSGLEESNSKTGEVLTKDKEIISYSRTDIDSIRSIITGLGENGLVLLNNEKDKSVKTDLVIKTEEGFKVSKGVRTLYYDKDKDELWTAGWADLWKTNLSSTPYKPIKIDSIQRVTEILKHKNNIIISSNRGLYKISDTDSIENIDLHTDLPLCNALGTSAKNEVFIAIQGYGIKVLNSDYEIIEDYNREFGLKPSNIYSLELDDNENIWAGTSNGLLHIDRKKNTSKYYTYNDGIGQNDFNYQSSLKTKDGTMYFGGINRLVKFHPDSILEADKNLKVKLLNAYTRNRNEVSFNSVYDTRNLSISIEHPELKLSFGFDNILEQTIGNLMYQIDDSKWMDLINGELTLKELSTGTHHIKVKHKYNKNNILETSVYSRYPLPVVLYKWVCIFLAGGLVIYLTNLTKRKRLRMANNELENQVNLRTKEIKQTNTDLQKSNDTKDKIFSVLAHDLRSPINNLLNLTGTVNFLVEKNRLGDLQKIGKDIQKKTNHLKSLIDNILHWSLQQQDKTFLVDNKFKVLGPIETTVDLFSSLAEEKNITLIVKVPDEHTLVTDYSAFEIIIRNLLYNAIKYSYNGGSVKITSEKIGNDKIRISIEDEGVGITNEQIDVISKGTYQSTLGPYKEKGTGIGLTLSKHFAFKMKGHIFLTQNSDKGCRATLTLPMKSDYQTP